MKEKKQTAVESSMIGRIGETYVIYKLATLGIHAMKVSEHFEFDLLVSNGLRLEVKTGRIGLRKRKYKDKINTWYDWSFSNYKKNDFFEGSKKSHSECERIDRGCDYFVCVCLDKDKNIERCYVIPKKEVGTKMGICIGISDKKHQYDKYRDRWDLLKGGKEQ